MGLPSPAQKNYSSGQWYLWAERLEARNEFRRKGRRRELQLEDEDLSAVDLAGPPRIPNPPLLLRRRRSLARSSTRRNAERPPLRRPRRDVHAGGTRGALLRVRHRARRRGEPLGSEASLPPVARSPLHVRLGLAGLICFCCVGFVWTTEKAIIRKDKHLEDDGVVDADDEVIYKIEVAANR